MSHPIENLSEDLLTSTRSQVLEEVQESLDQPAERIKDYDRYLDYFNNFHLLLPRRNFGGVSSYYQNKQFSPDWETKKFGDYEIDGSPIYLSQTWPDFLETVETALNAEHLSRELIMDLVKRDDAHKDIYFKDLSTPPNNTYRSLLYGYTFAAYVRLRAFGYTKGELAR